LLDDQAEDLASASGADYVPLADDQAQAAGASLGPLPDEVAAKYEPVYDQADTTSASYDPTADQIACIPDVAAPRWRSRFDPIRARLDRRQVERCKLAGTARSPRRPPQQRQVFADMLPALNHEIGCKRSAGIQAMYQAANASTEPSPSVEQAAPTPGVVRRVWHSAFVPFDTPFTPLPPREVPPHTHPITELGTNPFSMRAAHEYCERMMAGLGESAITSVT
jgi:hypothetical protein